MRLIFLDIDGVLNSDAWDKTKKTTSNDFLIDQFDPEAIKLLNELIEKIDAQIVLTSSWRLNFDLEQMNELFSRIGIKRGIVSFTPNLNAGAGYLTRGNEVSNWIIDNGNIIKSKSLSFTDYIILDSISPIRERFIGTNNIKYDHIYFLAITNKNITPYIDKNNINQIIEIKNINWFTRDDAVKLIRKYETEKKKIINIGFNIISNIKQYLIN